MSSKTIFKVEGNELQIYWTTKETWYFVFVKDFVLLLMQGLLEGDFSRITTLWITLKQILPYHDLAFL